MTEERLLQKEAAERLGITARQLRRLPDTAYRRAEDGKYLWPETRKRYIAFKQSEVRRRSGLDQSPSREAQTRKWAAQAELVELELAERRGEVVRLDEAARDVEDLLERARATLLAIPGRWSDLLATPERPAKEVRPILERAIAEALGELRKSRAVNDPQRGEAA